MIALKSQRKSFPPSFIAELQSYALHRGERLHPDMFNLNSTKWDVNMILEDTNSKYTKEDLEYNKTICELQQLLTERREASSKPKNELEQNLSELKYVKNSYVSSLIKEFLQSKESDKSLLDQIVSLSAHPSIEDIVKAQLPKLLTEKVSKVKSTSSMLKEHLSCLNRNARKPKKANHGKRAYFYLLLFIFKFIVYRMLLEDLKIQEVVNFRFV